MAASMVTLAGVLGFALCMIVGWLNGEYASSMFIAWGFVPMVCAFAAFSKPDRKAPAGTAVAFSAVYTVLVMLAYFAQLTTVRLNALDAQAAQLLDYGRFGLIFNYDILGYAFMALSTFFIAFAVDVRTRADKWLKGLLLAHGVFAVGCVIIPMLGIFKDGMGGGAAGGTIALESWCAYFTPVCILAFVHFRRKERLTAK